MKVSVITTVKNEEKTIRDFVRLLVEQTRKPDEIIVVDAYSSDRTYDILQEIKKQYRSVDIKVLQHTGNRSRGRNKAISISSYDIIAVTDAGCIPEKRWLENILRPFEEKTIEEVAGFYRPQTRSVFEQCLACYTCVMPDSVNKDTFLPSSRSIAFRKSLWKKVGEYPEHINTCEDLVFAKKLEKAGSRRVFVGDAIVWWPQRKNLLQATRQFFVYALGDGTARYIRWQTPLLYVRYAIGLVLLVAFLYSQDRIFLYILTGLCILYLVWSIQKNYRYVDHIKACMYLPVLQLVSDIMVLTGTSIGLLKSLTIHEYR